METKDLVLLLAIPILLIGVLQYAGRIAPITGYAAAEDKPAKLGTYSIMPSFRAKIDYNLEKEYQEVASKLMEMIGQCKSQDMEKCLKSKSAWLGWDCGESEQDILYDFIHKLNDCINYNGDEILCRFSFDKREFLNKVKPERSFEIKLINWYGRIRAELLEDAKPLAADFINMEKLAYTGNREIEAKDANSVTIKVKYMNGNPAVEDAYAITPESARFDLSKTFHLYKKNENVNFIDLGIEGLFRTSVPSASLPTTKGMRFCVKTGKQIFAYDESDKTAKLRDIDYRFSITFPKSPPIPIQKLEAFDALKSENSVILVWDKPKEEIDYYSIYYSEKNFADIKTEDILKDKNIKKADIDLDNKIEIGDIDINDCRIWSLGSPCKYGAYNNPLQPNKLYYWKSKDKYLYVLKGVLDGKEHNFAVVAANNAGQLDNDKSIEGNTYTLSEGSNYARFAPADDLAPGKITGLGGKLTADGNARLEWSKPLKNIDGSDAADVAGFDVYYKKSASDILPQLEPAHETRRITSADAKCGSAVALACEYSLAGLNLERNINYNFAVIAFDENWNDYKAESEKTSIIIS